MTNDESEEEEENDNGADELEPCPNVHIDVDDPSVRGEYGMVVLEEEDILAVAGLNSEDFSEDFGPVDVATVQDESTVASAVRIHILPVDGEDRGWLEWIRQVDEDLATAIERYLNDCVSGMQQPVLQQAAEYDRRLCAQALKQQAFQEPTFIIRTCLAAPTLSTLPSSARTPSWSMRQPRMGRFPSVRADRPKS